MKEDYCDGYEFSMGDPKKLWKFLKCQSVHEGNMQCCVAILKFHHFKIGDDNKMGDENMNFILCIWITKLC